MQGTWERNWKGEKAGAGTDKLCNPSLPHSCCQCDDAANPGRGQWFLECCSCPQTTVPSGAAGAAPGGTPVWPALLPGCHFPSLFTGLPVGGEGREAGSEGAGLLWGHRTVKHISVGMGSPTTFGKGSSWPRGAFLGGGGGGWVLQSWLFRGPSAQSQPISGQSPKGLWLSSSSNPSSGRLVSFGNWKLWHSKPALPFPKSHGFTPKTCVSSISCSDSTCFLGPVRSEGTHTSWGLKTRQRARAGQHQRER